MSQCFLDARWKPRASDHPGPTSFNVLMINRDKLPSTAEIDLNGEHGLPPEARSPYYSCHEMAFERLLIRKVVSLNYMVRSTEVFLQTEQWSLCLGNDSTSLWSPWPYQGISISLWLTGCCSNSCQFCSLIAILIITILLILQGQEWGHRSAALTLTSPGHIPLYLCTLVT